MALTANAPPGLADAINFAGGRGSRADNDVCDEDALVRAFATLGKTSRIPTLWIYAQNDKFFGPELVRRMRNAFTGAGGRAQFVDFPQHGEDGHSLFSRGIALWTPVVDGFLRDQNLGTREGARDLPIISRRARTGPWPSRQRELSLSAAGAAQMREAAEAALTACAEYAPDCALYAVDDHLADTANAGSR